MKKASSRHLTHMYPIWQGCTLGEILMVVGVVFALTFVVILVLSMFVGHLSACLLLYIPVIFTVPKRACSWVANLKKDKPHGYFTIYVLMSLEKYTGGFVKTPYIKHLGQWSSLCRLPVKKSD